MLCVFLSLAIEFKSTFGNAFKASSLVILPPLPEPVTEDIGIFFSLKILDAAGDGVPIVVIFSTITFGFSTDLTTSTAFSFSSTLFSLGAFAEVSIKQTT